MSSHSKLQLAVIGLWQTGVRGSEAMANLIFKTPPTPRRLERIQKILDRGHIYLGQALKHGSNGKLTNPVRCPRCGALVLVVPCVSCHATLVPAGRRRRKHEGPRDIPPLPPFSTLALPGTVEKIGVMAERVSLGFQPCHPEDVALENRHKQPYDPRIVDLSEVYAAADEESHEAI